MLEQLHRLVQGESKQGRRGILVNGLTVKNVRVDPSDALVDGRLISTCSCAESEGRSSSALSTSTSLEGPLRSHDQIATGILHPLFAFFLEMLEQLHRLVQGESKQGRRGILVNGLTVKNVRVDPSDAL